MVGATPMSVARSAGKPAAGVQAQILVSGRHTAGRQFLRAFIHFFAYHLFLTRRSHRRVKAAGFRLDVAPTVFDPRVFITSEFFARFILALDLSGKRVADVGTGTGILALAAARAGASRVVALDINPAAVGTAQRNAASNNFGDRMIALESDLLAALPPQPAFEVIISSPPSFPGEPRDVADRAWHAGPDYRDIADLFTQAKLRLAPGGVMYLLLSSDSDLTRVGALISAAGFQASLVAERSILIERFILLELRQSED
jgi:release factor glutamine methyltransferase